MSSRRRETNPHFLSPSHTQPQVPYSQPQHGPDIYFTPQQPRRPQNHHPGPQDSPPSPHFPINNPQHLHSQHDPHPQHSTSPDHLPPTQQHQPTQHVLPPQRPPSSLRVPPPHKTRPHTWLIGAFCAFFWIAIILGGLVVLVVFLIFRPGVPQFDLSNASLNAAYLDMGYLLNADMTLLVNFTNPSKKVTVDFSFMFINLYYGNTLIATTYVEPFSAISAESVFQNVHLVSSQVWLSLEESKRLQQQIESNTVIFEVKGLLRTRSNLGSFLRYSYWLYGHCLIELTGPPSGVLVGKKCITKR